MDEQGHIILKNPSPNTLMGSLSIESNKKQKPFTAPKQLNLQNKKQDSLQQFQENDGQQQASNIDLDLNSE